MGTQKPPASSAVWHTQHESRIHGLLLLAGDLALVTFDRLIVPDPVQLAGSLADAETHQLTPTQFLH